MDRHVVLLRGETDEEHRLRGEFQARGKKLDMGKGCIRFKKIDDLPLDVLGAAVARVPLADYIRRYEAATRK